MDDSKKTGYSTEKTHVNLNTSKKKLSNNKTKFQGINLYEKKLTNPIIYTNQLHRNLTERSNLSIAKKHNSIGFPAPMKKLGNNNSIKKFELNKRTSNISNSNSPMNNLNYMNSLANSSVTKERSDNNANNNINNIIQTFTQSNSNKPSIKEDEKDRDAANACSILNTDAQNGRVSLLSGNVDNSINQHSVLDSKYLAFLTPPNANTIANANITQQQNSLNIAHTNSINNFSGASDSSQIKVVVRFRPMNNVENVKLIYFY